MNYHERDECSYAHVGDDQVMYAETPASLARRALPPIRDISQLQYDLIRMSLMHQVRLTTPPTPLPIAESTHA